MSVNPSTPWHKISYDLFLHERLPLLLAEHLPLTGYQVIPAEGQTCKIEVRVQSVSVTYEGMKEIGQLNHRHTQEVFHQFLDFHGEIETVPVVSR